MDILFSGGRFQKICNNSKLAVRRLGVRQAKLLRRRLAELEAASVLDEMRYLPAPRCHALRGNLSGKLSVDLDHPYRLIFEPANEPLPTRADGGLDWTRVTAIRVVGIKDTHE